MTTYRWVVLAPIAAFTLSACGDPEVVGPGAPAFASGPPGGFEMVVVTTRVPATSEAGAPRVTKLADAVGLVRPGGTIVVEDGEWETAGVVIDRPLTMLPRPGHRPLLVNNGPENGLTIDGVAQGAVELRGLRFLNAAGLNAVHARGTYDRVVIRDAEVEVTAPAEGAGTAHGVNVTTSGVAGAYAVVENTTFVGGRFGAIALQGATLVVRGSRFSGQSVSSVQHSFGAKGRVENSEFSGCGSNACITAHEPTDVVIANNRIRHPLGTARRGILAFVSSDGLYAVVITGNEVRGTGVQPDDLRPYDRPINASALHTGIVVGPQVRGTVVGNRVSGGHWGIRASGIIADNIVGNCGWVCIGSFLPRFPTVIEGNRVTADIAVRRALAGIVGQRQEPAATISIRNNDVVGNRAGDPDKALSYAFFVGIQALSWDDLFPPPLPEVTGLPVLVSGNRVTNVGLGLNAVAGGSMEAYDNVISGMARAIAVPNPLSVMTANRNDILDAAAGVAGGGAINARCNWWGSAAGPTNPGVSPGVYTPFATVPIANQPAVVCG